jgi:hypothetical protein
VRTIVTEKNDIFIKMLSRFYDFSEQEISEKKWPGGRTKVPTTVRDRSAGAFIRFFCMTPMQKKLAFHLYLNLIGIIIINNIRTIINCRVKRFQAIYPDCLPMQAPQ